METTQKFGNLEYHTNSLGRIVVQKQIGDQKLCIMIFVMSRDRWIVDDAQATSLNDIKFPKTFLAAQIEALELMEYLNLQESQVWPKRSAILQLIYGLDFIAEEHGEYSLPKTDAAFVRMESLIRDWFEAHKTKGTI